MTPVDPDVTAEGWELRVYDKHGRRYAPLPCLFQRGVKGRVVTRWRPTAEELTQLLEGADICLEVLTFLQPLQPVRLSVWTEEGRELDA